LIHGGRVKLADFGFAKYVMSDTALQKSVVGTPKYMSPEILKRVKYTSKCDVWSIGAIFYEVQQT
jgi:serine/threonine-protein kinase ULK/ATG1